MVEDQVTYPLTTAMLTVPKSRVVRGFSFFGVSFVYVIFEDGTDHLLGALARARKSELGGAAPAVWRDADSRTRRDRRRLGVPICGARRAERTLAELRTVQDWFIRFGSPRLKAWPRSRASAASSSNIASSSIRAACRRSAFRSSKIRDAIRESNMDVGGRTVEVSETEYRRCADAATCKSISDLEQIVAQIRQAAFRCCCRDVARVELSPDERRGITELNGEGEVVSGIALQRFGENALSRHRECEGSARRDAPSLPEGRDDRSSVRPLGSDQPRHRYA